MRAESHSAPTPAVEGGSPSLLGTAVSAEEDSASSAEAIGRPEAGGASSASECGGDLAVAAPPSPDDSAAAATSETATAPSSLHRARKLSKHSSDDRMRAKLALPTDRWGFLELEIDETRIRRTPSHVDRRTRTLSEKHARSDDSRLERLRTEKWRAMFAVWTKWESARNRVHLKLRVRKGIPDAVRTEAWMRISSALPLYARQPDLLAGLLAGAAERAEEVPDQIVRDLHRTFPDHRMFAQKGGVGQVALSRLLHASFLLCPDVGYCQGQGFIGAALLLYVPEEQGLFVMRQLLLDPKYKMVDLFRPGASGFYFGRGLLRRARCCCRAGEGPRSVQT